MKERGFSLIELMVVLCVMGIVMGMTTLRFSDYSRRANKEQQVRILQSELLSARVSSLHERRGRRVKLASRSFAVYSSLVDDEKGAAPVVQRQLHYPITWNNSGCTVDFDERGLAATQRSICLDDLVDTGIVDSIVVSQTRLNLGSRGEGKECESEGIVVR